jgi:hypothetical protein
MKPLPAPGLKLNTPTVTQTVLTGLGTGAALLGGKMLHILAEHLRAGDVVGTLQPSASQLHALKDLAGDSYQVIKDNLFQIHVNTHPYTANDLQAFRGLLSLPTAALLLKHLDHATKLLTWRPKP